MRKWLWVVAGCIVFGVSLLAHLPAQMVIPEQYGKLRFAGVDGTLWHGEVEQILLEGKALPTRDLEWTVKPAALLTGVLKADFHEQQTPTNRGTIGLRLRSRQLELQALHWQIPGSSLDSWFRAGVSLKGQLVLDLQTLQLPANSFFPLRLEGQLEWPNAALQYGPEHWRIGSPLMRFSGQGESMEGVVTNSQPILPGDGSFECTTTSCRIELNLQPGPEAPPSVLNGLLLLGLQQRGIEFSGQITLPLE